MQLKNGDENGEKSREEMGMLHNPLAAQVVGESQKHHQKLWQWKLKQESTGLKALTESWYKETKARIKLQLP